MAEDTASDTAGDAAGSEGVYLSLDELADKRIAVQEGTVIDLAVQEKMPKAKVNYYNNTPDLVAALKANKVDALGCTEIFFRQYLSEDEALCMIGEPLQVMDIAYLFPKADRSRKLSGEINEYIKKMESEGKLEELKDKWIGGSEDRKTIDDYSDLPATNGTIRYVTEGLYPPFNYVREGKDVGLEIELTGEFCREYGYALNITNMSFDALMPALTAGKYDLSASGIAVTEERKKNVLFSDPYIQDRIVIAVLRKDADKSLFGSLTKSFNNTFIKEHRYRLFTRGMLTTLLISVLSIIFGTVLGFLVFLLYRKGNRIANKITGFAVWLVQGMPLVVFLMILYYVILGKVNIDGVWVAVLGFTILFGASVYCMLKSGTEAVGAGQTEASYALGFNDRETFFGIVLPQAARHFMPSYNAHVR
ncbi:MAG: ABC transporter permease subunit [Eubacterium sp.]|nr:ABC transporter permease subunit [Eubacterium sp.]